ncbi:oligosaccharyl transferase glycoprotein complex, beta subunit, partial [Spiromyces aspiralis]
MYAGSLWRTAVAGALCLLSVALGTVHARSTAGDRVLIFLPNEQEISNYSYLLESLKGRGFGVTARAASDKSAQLFDYDTRLYDHVILLAPEAKSFGKRLGLAEFIRFTNDGGNMLV